MLPRDSYAWGHMGKAVTFTIKIIPFVSIAHYS